MFSLNPKMALAFKTHSTSSPVSCSFISVIVLPLLLIFRVGAFQCDRSCPGSFRNLPSPFGTSEGCPVRMSCDRRLAGFPVKRLNGRNMEVLVARGCGFSLESLKGLYGSNHAPTATNLLVLANCPPVARTCQLPDFYTPPRCPAIGCYRKNMTPGEEPGLMDFEAVSMTGCKSVADSLITKRKSMRVIIEFSKMEVEWWVDGHCRCGPHAECKEWRGADGATRHTCRCPKWYVGDGFLSCHRLLTITEARLILVSIILLVIALIACFIWWCFRVKNRLSHEIPATEGHAETPTTPDETIIGADETPTAAGPIGYLRGIQFDFEAIKVATDNFSDLNIIGSGGFGNVYKGRLVNGDIVAVKRLSRASTSSDPRQGDLQFRNEADVAVSLNHRNLVKFLGDSTQGSERLLSFEFVPNGSLDRYIFDDPNQKQTMRANLDWDVRFKIIKGIGRGLIYIHEDSRLRVIHRDIKAGNIFLDERMEPKIGDFGLSRFILGTQDEGRTDHFTGTYGHTAPEICLGGHYSAKSDVYSFGVLLLEIVSGQKINSSTNPGLINKVWSSWQQNSLLDIVDANMTFTPEMETSIIRCIHMGLLCMQTDISSRPTMAQVVEMLTSNTPLLQELEEPKLARIESTEQRATSGSHDREMQELLIVARAAEAARATEAARAADGLD